MTKNTQKIIIGGGIVLLLVGVAAFFFLGTQEADLSSVLYEDGEMRPYTSEPSGEVLETTYECINGDGFTTKYDMGSNELTVEAGPDDVYVLPQSVSEAGARYATFDERVIFFEFEDRASVEVDGELIYEDCLSV